MTLLLKGQGTASTELMGRSPKKGRKYPMENKVNKVLDIEIEELEAKVAPDGEVVNPLSAPTKPGH